MKNFKVNNFHIKILSILLAISLWFYVGYEQNPLADTKVDVDIEYENLNSDYIILQKPQSISVTLKGRKDKISQMDKDDLKVSVDLSEANIGNDEYAFTVKNNTQMDIVSTSPKKAKLVIDEVITKSLKVEPKVSGSVKDGYNLASVVAEPSSISVRGPKSVLDELQFAQVQFSVDGLMQNVNETSEAILIDNSGNVLENNLVKILTPNVNLALQIAENDPTKIVPVKAMIVGNVANGYDYTSTVMPYNVTISGKSDIIDNISVIKTYNINIDDISESINRDVSLILPEGVSLVNTTKVRVNINVTSVITEEVVQVPIEIKGNVGEVVLNKDKVKVTLSGSSEDILKEKNNLKVYVDASNVVNGVSTLDLKTEGLKNVSVKKMEFSSVEVNVNNEQ